MSSFSSFQVTSNIGALRPDDLQKWVKLFNSMFIVMNENKHILSWHLTLTKVFNNVGDILEKLHKRIGKGKFKYIVLDDCCK